MNKAKIIISFILGAGVGSLVTWKLLDAQYEERFQDELESMKIMAERELRRKKDGFVVANEYENVKKRYNINEQRAEDVDPDEEEEEEEIDFPDDVELDEEGNPIKPEYDVYPVPYPLSEEEFSTECLGFDKLSLKYYCDDQTLCDDQEVPVDDIMQLVGEETSDYLIKSAHPAMTVYVRNEGTSTDFEITIIENSYANEVLGYGEENTGKKKVKKGKKGENSDK